MRSVLAAAATFAVFANAISVPGLPSCAGSCVSSDFGGCGSLNVTCICSNEPLIANLACCVSKACSASDQAATLQFADSLCQGSGVSDLPQSATCAPGAQSTLAGASSSGASSSGASSTGAAAATTGSATGESSSATGSASSTAAGASSTAASSASGSSAAASASATGSSGAGLTFEPAMSAVLTSVFAMVGFGAVMLL